VVLALIAVLLAFNLFFTRPALVQAQGIYRLEGLRVHPNGSSQVIDNQGQIVGTCSTGCMLILR
jgi:hypothetical protein